MENKMGKLRLNRSSSTPIVQLSRRAFIKTKKTSDNVDEVDEIHSPDTSTQSTESLPSPSSAVTFTTEFDPQEENLIIDDDINNNNSIANSSGDTEIVNQDTSPGLIKVPTKVIKMINNARTTSSMYSEILLDGCVPPLRLIDTPAEFNGIRHKWYITADDVARKICRKNIPPLVDLVDD